MLGGDLRSGYGSGGVDGRLTSRGLYGRMSSGGVSGVLAPLPSGVRGPGPSGVLAPRIGIGGVLGPPVVTGAGSGGVRGRLPLFQLPRLFSFELHLYNKYIIYHTIYINKPFDFLYEKI